MSNRFSNLKSTSDSNESKQNVFRQKPKPSQDHRQHPHQHQQRQHPQQPYKHRSQNQSRFRSTNSNIAKTPQFQIKQESFPTLLSTTAPSIIKTDYMSKAKSLPKITSDKPNIPKGYVILSNEKHTFKGTKKDIIDEIMPSRRCAQLIFENRQTFREELNDMLGDISPYWNMDHIDSDNDDYSDDGWYSEEEEYVLDEW